MEKNINLEGNCKINESAWLFLFWS
jgi:hypothetical protein